MHPHRLMSVLLLVFAFFALPATAQDREGPQESLDAKGILSLLPADSTTSHVLKTGKGDLPYTATAGTLSVFGQDAAIAAKVFYTAYVAKERDQNRPLTFVFNGGPGAASAYLHMGLVGPKVLEFDQANRDGTTPRLTDNPDSWLEFTDLVLIDPVGTGWSRAADDDDAKGFYGVRQDAESLAKVISLYVQQNGRIASPKYLLGESYGGFRAAKVASALKDSQGILVSGIIMVSPLIEGRFIFGADDDPLRAALQLPSLVAAERERKGTFSSDAVARAEAFAMTDYLVALAGAPPTGERADAFYKHVSELTGVPVDSIARAGGFIGDSFARNVEGNAGKIASNYDASYMVPDPYPEAPSSRSSDSILDGYTRAYGAALASYARSELGFSCPMTYTLLSEDVNRAWDWGTGRSRTDAGATDDLRELLSIIPSFRLLVVHGYSDPLTPYGVSKYLLGRLPPSLAKDRTELRLYRGGHMFYTNPEARRSLTEDARNYFAGYRRTE